MLVTKGYRYRIYPTAEQEERFSGMFGCSRFVYNYCLDYKESVYKAEKRNVSKGELSALLPKLKKAPETAWLSACDSMALQEAVEDLVLGYKAFFKGLAEHPKHHGKRGHKQSYRTRNQNGSVRIEGSRIRLPKVGLVKIRMSRFPSGQILGATVTKAPSGRFFVSLCVREEIEPKPNAGGMIGIDVGLTHFLTDSDGNTVDSPKPLKKYSKKLSREQRRLSRKHKGSNNYEKQRIRVARVHEKVANIRSDFQHKLSNRLVSDNQVIGAETLSVKEMQKNKRLARLIADAGWYGFIRMLIYKGFEHGTEVVLAPEFFASSQTCSACGYKNPAVKDLKIRQWDCPACGMHHDRDCNSAKNLLAYAMSGG